MAKKRTNMSDPQKGDKTNWENFRGISMPDITYKVIRRIIKNILFHDTVIEEN